MIVKIQPEDKKQVATVVDCTRFHTLNAGDHVRLVFFDNKGIKVHEVCAGEGDREHVFVLENGHTVDHIVIHGQKEGVK